jgi:cathepsin B
MRAAVFAGLYGLCGGHPISQEIVDAVNKNQAGWVAEDPEKNVFAGRSVDEIRGLMGLKDYDKKPQVSAGAGVDVADIPDAFDARTQWPSCKAPIRDQAHCGSCWAFGAAETLTDNLCVLGLDPPVLSPQDLISCDMTDHACKGGTLPDAWKYIAKNGLEADSSVPYKSGDGSCNNTCVPACSHSLPDPSGHKCPVAPTFLQSDSEIQGAIMTVGAVEVGFFVMEDFMNYKSGIYKYQTGVQLGGHAVKVVGWGKEVDQFYWIVQNSWGPSWGEQGYFRIENWHDDKESAFAIGGGQACVKGTTPKPPSPAPPPEKCKDVAGYCAKEAPTQADCRKKSYLVPVCKKTCGCCESDPGMRPDYCPKTTPETTSLLV